MIYELRIYTCLPGRLPALLKRFETATIKIWEKHGPEPGLLDAVLLPDLDRGGLEALEQGRQAAGQTGVDA